MDVYEKKERRMPCRDEEIVNLYWARDEKAIGETDYKYGKYLYTVLYNIVRDDLDCEECLNSTYFSAWNAMPPSKPVALKAFLITIARRVAIKRYHSNTRKVTVPPQMTIALEELEDLIEDNDNTASMFDAMALGQSISDFVEALSSRRQYIFLNRYYLAEPIDTIAKELNLSRSMVNKELTAIRTLLREKLEREGYLI